MTFLHLVVLLVGLMSAEEVYRWTVKRVKTSPRVIVQASPLRGQIESFKNHQLEIEGKTTPALESPVLANREQGNRTFLCSARHLCSMV